VDVKDGQGTKWRRNIAENFNRLSSLKAKFHYASWFGAGSMPNSITLSGSNQLRTSFEPSSVMEFGFNKTNSNKVSSY